MKKLAAVAVISCFAGYVCAQTPQSAQTETKTTTTTVNLNGTLLDQGCYTTHTREKETKAGENSSTTTETSKIVTECPVTTTTTSFGILTPEGKFVRFDDAGNMRTVEMVKSNKDWSNYIVERKPVKVRVVGTPNGDVVVVKEIK
jgi:hypothetical protein